jgi:hypothetical protein
MNGQGDTDEGLEGFGVGSGEPATPEADKFLEQAVKEAEGDKSDKPGEQTPEAGKTADDANKPDEQQHKQTVDEGAGKPKEQPEDFEKIENPNGEHWKQARERMKQQAQRIKDLEQGGAKPKEEGAAADREPARQPTPGRGDIQPGMVFETLAKVVSGEETKFQRADVEAYIQSRMTPAQVKDVIDAARKGQFGEASEEIAALAKDQLNEVIANADKNREREQAHERVMQDRATATKELLDAFPEAGGKDTAHPVYKEVDAACRELEGIIPNFSSLPHAPRVVKQFVEMQRKAARLDALTVERDSLKKENERLAKLVGRSARPPAGGGKETDSQGKGADAWLAEQAAAGALTGLSD